MSPKSDLQFVASL